MNCGECLMDHQELVPLDADGICPECGVNYGPPPADQDK